jgi:uncharacterized membrane protein
MSGPAPSLVAIVLADPSAADQALAEVRALEADHVGVRDAAVVTRTARGRIELQQTRQMAAGEGVVAGGSVGLVAGLLLGLPIVGALIGLLGGAGFGLRDTGIPDRRLRKLGKRLERGQSLLCVLVEPDDAERTRTALAGYGETLEGEASEAAEP